MDIGTGVDVLVVEDDSDTRHVLQLILEDAGYTVTQASDGIAALDLLRSSPVPLVVLLDWWLPKLDGISVLEAIGHDSAGRSCHAYILMTAASEALAAKLARMPLIVTPSVLAKPFGMKRLLDTVASAAHSLHAGAALDASRTMVTPPATDAIAVNSNAFAPNRNQFVMLDTLRWRLRRACDGGTRYNNSAVRGARV